MKSVTVSSFSRSICKSDRTRSHDLGFFNHKLESRLPGEISVTSDIQMTSP